MPWAPDSDASSSCLDEDAVVRMAVGAMEGSRAREARSHLERCDDCRALAVHVSRTHHETRDALVAQALIDDPDGDLPRGTIAGRYELGELLGAGGMGFVMAAVDIDSGVRVAVKFMHREIARDPNAVRRFEREASAMATLESPHTARIWHVGKDRDLPFFVMEYLDGISLAALVEKCGRIGWSDAARYISDACIALVEAHEKGIIHRDIKPQNLFLCSNAAGDVVRVLDFGVAKTFGSPEGLTASARMLGTPQYMAPEQIRDARETDARTDVWALGATLYRLVSGHHAFPGANAGVVCGEVLHGSPATLRSRCSDCPAALEAIVMRCLRKDPAERFASAAALAAELQKVVYGVPPCVGQRKRRVLALVAGAVALATVGSAAFAARPRATPAVVTAQSAIVAHAPTFALSPSPEIDASPLREPQQELPAPAFAAPESPRQSGVPARSSSSSKRSSSKAETTKASKPTSTSLYDRF